MFASDRAFSSARFLLPALFWATGSARAARLELSPLLDDLRLDWLGKRPFRPLAWRQGMACLRSGEIDDHLGLARPPPLNHNLKVPPQACIKRTRAGCNSRRHEHEKLRRGRHQIGHFRPPSTRPYTTGPSCPPHMTHVSSSFRRPQEGQDGQTPPYTLDEKRGCQRAKRACLRRRDFNECSERRNMRKCWLMRLWASYSKHKSVIFMPMRGLSLYHMRKYCSKAPERPQVPVILLSRV